MDTSVGLLFHCVRRRAAGSGYSNDTVNTGESKQVDKACSLT